MGVFFNDLLLRLERLFSVIVNFSMRTVMSLQQISGSKLKTVVINSTGQRKLSGETELNF